jgi:hypothetical protein
MYRASSIRLFAFSVPVLTLAMLASGCGRPPAVEFENLNLISSLRTACSARNEGWLTGVGKAVELRHQEGRMTEREKAHFERLIKQARGGDWAGAEQLCFQFEKAQLNRRRAEPSHREPSHHVEAVQNTRQGVALAKP